MAGRLSLRVSADRHTIYHHLTVNPPTSKHTTLTVASKNYDHIVDGVVLNDSESDDDYFDPCFFDADYTIAATSAHLVWEGALILLRYLYQHAEIDVTIDDGEEDREPCDEDEGVRRSKDLARTLCRNLRDSRIVDLGSGTGVLGLGLAFFTGGSVMCTDVASVVAKGGFLWNNVARENLVEKNEVLETERATSDRRSSPTREITVAIESLDVTRKNASQSQSPADASATTTKTSPWPVSKSFGEGSVTYPQALDWSLPLSSQRDATGNDPVDCDIVIAAECVWLKELAPHFVKTVADLLALDGSRSPSRAPKACFWAYKERGTKESKVFTTLSEVRGLFEEKDCDVVELYREKSKEDEGKWVTINLVTKQRI